MNKINKLLPTLTSLTAALLLTEGCDKSPSPSHEKQVAPGSQISSPPPKIVAEPFRGQVYKSPNGATVLTLVSPDECEIAENNTTLLCKYSKVGGKLRIVTTALGTSQVLYFRFTSQGLEDDSGNVFLSPKEYAAYMAKVETENRSELHRQELEKQRIATELANSIVATKTISTFSLPPQNYDNTGNTINIELKITDVSLKLHIVTHPPANAREASDDIELPFSEISWIDDGEFRDGYEGSFGGTHYHYWFTVHPEGAWWRVLYGKDSKEGTQMRDAVRGALKAWQTKFPHAVKL